MLTLCRVTKVKVLFLVKVYVFNFNLFEFSATILEKGLLTCAVANGFAILKLLHLLYEPAVVVTEHESLIERYFTRHSCLV